MTGVVIQEYKGFPYLCVYTTAYIDLKKWGHFSFCRIVSWGEAKCQVPGDRHNVLLLQRYWSFHGYAAPLQMRASCSPAWRHTGELGKARTNAERENWGRAECNPVIYSYSNWATVSRTMGQELGRRDCILIHPHPVHGDLLELSWGHLTTSSSKCLIGNLWITVLVFTLWLLLVQINREPKYKWLSTSPKKGERNLSKC